MKRKVILASSSPRRKELLEGLGFNFTVKPSKIPEKMNPRLGPKARAENLSLQKAKAVAKRVKNALIIAADTIVVLQNEIIGKPESPDHAKRMLKKLQGRKHIVITGFTILDTESGKLITKAASTNVYMKKLTVKEIDAYFKKEHVLDKAGSYAMQGLGGILFEKIEGDYFTVVGLPLHALAVELKKFGVNILA